MCIAIHPTEVSHMRIEYWARVRVRNNSYYITLPRAEAYKLTKVLAIEDLGLEGTEVKVEVTL